MTGPIPVSDEPSPLLLYWPKELLFLAGFELQLKLGVMKPFSVLIPLVIPESSQHYAPCPHQCCLKPRALAGEELGSTCSGFIMALGDVHKSTWYYVKIQYFSSR